MNTIRRLSWAAVIVGVGVAISPTLMLAGGKADLNVPLTRQSWRYDPA